MNILYCFSIFVAEKVLKSIMKKILQFLKIIPLFIFLPFEISKASKRRMYLKIKKSMAAARLL